MSTGPQYVPSTNSSIPQPGFSSGSLGWIQLNNDNLVEGLDTIATELTTILTESTWSSQSVDIGNSSTNQTVVLGNATQPGSTVIVESNNMLIGKWITTNHLSQAPAQDDGGIVQMGGNQSIGDTNYALSHFVAGVGSTNAWCYCNQAGLLPNDFISVVSDTNLETGLYEVLLVTGSSNPYTLTIKSTPGAISQVQSFCQPNFVSSLTEMATAIKASLTVLKLASGSNDPSILAVGQANNDNVSGMDFNDVLFNTYSETVSFTKTTDQLALGAANHVTNINSVAPAAASQTIRLIDSGAANDDFLLASAQQTVKAKNLTDNTVDFISSADSSKVARFNVGGQTTGTTLILATANTSSQTQNLQQAPGDTFVYRATTDSLTNKKLVAESVSFVDSGDATKSLSFSVAGKTTGTATTFIDQNSASKSLYVPQPSGSSDVILARTTTDTLTNKTITDSSNIVCADLLRTTDPANPVALGSAPGTAGQVLTLTDATHAHWETVDPNSYTPFTVNSGSGLLGGPLGGSSNTSGTLSIDRSPSTGSGYVITVGDGLTPNGSTNASSPLTINWNRSITSNATSPTDPAPSEVPGTPSAPNLDALFGVDITLGVAGAFAAFGGVFGISGGLGLADGGILNLSYLWSPTAILHQNAFMLTSPAISGYVFEYSSATATDGQIAIGSSIGSITAANITPTANQTTITNGHNSITTGLSSSLIAPGSLSWTTLMEYSSSTGVAAAGSNQQNAKVLTASFNQVNSSTVSTAQGVALPAAAAGMTIVISNITANPINVYPAYLSGASIDANSVGASVSLPSNYVGTWYASGNLNWYSFGLPVQGSTGLTNGGSASAPSLSIANTTVSANSYGSSSAFPTFTVNAQGQLTAAGSQTLSSIIPTAIAGTTNQISASASIGSITLSTPSTFVAPGSIQATTSLTAASASITNTSNQLALTTASSGNKITISAPTAASGNITGVIDDTSAIGNFHFVSDTAGSLNISNTGTNNYVLTATGSNTATWQAIAGGVSSIAGTANQITASASTGAITLSTPSTFIAPGSIAATTFYSDGTSSGLTATGSSSQSGSLLLTTSYNVITTVAAGSGVQLPVATAGLKITIVNRGGGNALNIYPVNGGSAQIDSAAANAAISLYQNESITLEAVSSTQWYSLLAPLQGGGNFFWTTASGYQQLGLNTALIWQGHTMQYDTSANLTATGNTQGGALALASCYNIITQGTVSTGIAVVLQSWLKGLAITVSNQWSHAISVYPPSGGIIDNGSTNAAVNLPPSQTATYQCSGVSGYWYTVSMAVSTANGGYFNILQGGTNSATALSGNEVLMQSNGSAITEATHIATNTTWILAGNTSAGSKNYIGNLSVDNSAGQPKFDVFAGGDNYPILEMYATTHDTDASILFDCAYNGSAVYQCATSVNPYRIKKVSGCLDFDFAATTAGPLPVAVGTFNTVLQITNSTNIIVNGNGGAAPLFGSIAGKISSATTLNIFGTASSQSSGPGIQTYTASDAYPLTQQLPLAHDNLVDCYDCYFDPTPALRSSSVNSNFYWNKTANVLSMWTGSAVAAGSLQGFVSNALQFNKDSSVLIPALYNSGGSTYSTGTAGTGGISSASISGSGTTWTYDMVGGIIVFSGGSVSLMGFITGFTSTTSLTVSASITVAAFSTYTIYYKGTQMMNAKVGVQNLYFPNSSSTVPSPLNWYAQSQAITITITGLYSGSATAHLTRIGNMVCCQIPSMVQSVSATNVITATFGGPFSDFASTNAWNIPVQIQTGGAIQLGCAAYTGSGSVITFGTPSGGNMTGSGQTTGVLSTMLTWIV